MSGQRKLENINIEDFSSLKYLDLKLGSEKITLRNLTALRDLKFELVESTFNSDIQVKLFDQLPNIQKLALIGDFSYFSLDNLIHLEELYLRGFINEDFNLDLFKSVCSHLTDLSIDCYNIDQKSMNKLFIGHQFPNLSKLRIANTKIAKLENRILSRFQSLKDLTVYNNRELKLIGYNSFSNLKQLTRLVFTENRVESFDKVHFSKLTKLEYLKMSGRIILKDNVFSKLKNLTYLDLTFCGLRSLKPKTFVGLEQLTTLDLRSNKLRRFDLRHLENLSQIKIIDLSGNSINNKEKILNHMKAYSNVEFKFSSIY